MTKHICHPQQIHLVVQVAIIPIFRFSAATANWDSKKFDKLSLARDSAGSSARVKQIVASAPNPIRLETRATFDLTDPVQFQEDFRAS